MDTNIHAFPLPEQEVDKLNQVSDIVENVSEDMASPRLATKSHSSPWSLLGLVTAATLTGVFLARRRT